MAIDHNQLTTGRDPMPVTQRDTQRHTYGDYLEWSRDYGDEVIDGVAYVREPPSPTWAHQELVVEISYQLRCALEGGSSRVCVAPLGEGGIVGAGGAWSPRPSTCSSVELA